AAGRYVDARSDGSPLRRSWPREEPGPGAVRATRLPRRARREHRVGHLGDHAGHHRHAGPRTAARNLERPHTGTGRSLQMEWRPTLTRRATPTHPRASARTIRADGGDV